MATYTKTLGTIFLLSTLAAIGCGPSDTNNNNTGGAGGEGGGGTTPNSLDALGDKLIASICDSAVDCHRAESAAECAAATQTNLDEIKAYVENGTVIYHPEKVDACLAAFSGLSICAYSEVNQNAQSDIQSACIDVFEGTIAEGGDCFDDEQCISDNCVVDQNCMEQCCAGKCGASTTSVGPAKAGESCAGDVECESGTYCQADNMGNPTTCAAQVDVGASCAAFDACKSPALCNFDFMTGMGTCKVPPGHGEACNPDDIFACDRFADVCDATSKTCVTKGVAGADCGSDDDCVEYAHCDSTTSKCVKNSLAGEACDVNDDFCIGDLQCINGVCGFEPTVVCK